ncbi:MAG: tetratricopeptide repeat protein [Rhodospirillales bacterium]|nr:tetratricopeptide repeat protein [Rhodospirillales bacterium]
MAGTGNDQGGSAAPESAAPESAAAALDRAIQLHRQGQHDQAIEAYSAILRADPAQPRVWVNLGVVLRAAGRLDAAVAAYRRAIALDPGNAGIHSNLGNVLRDLGRRDEAIAAQERALELDPSNHAASYNMALLLRDLGRWREALPHFDRCISGGHDRAEVRLDHATTLLAMGDYAAGFRAFEARLAMPDGAPANSEAPLWDGGALDGRSILVQVEQGPRDTLTFLRYVPMLAARGGRVTVSAPATMAQMIAALPGVSLVVPGGRAAPRTDLRVPLNSLPLLFGTRPDTVPRDLPYLRLPTGRLAREWFAPGSEADAVKVGVVWADRSRSRAADRGRPGRVCPFECFLRLAALPGVALYSLQTGPAAEDVQRLAAPALVRTPLAEFADLADAAEAILSLDLVVGVDSAVLILAAALGKPGIAVLPPGADWRWTDADGTPGAASPWFPSLALFRQEVAGDWNAVFDRVAQAVAAFHPDAPSLQPPEPPSEQPPEPPEQQPEEQLGEPPPAPLESPVDLPVVSAAGVPEVIADTASTDSLFVRAMAAPDAATAPLPPAPRPFDPRRAAVRFLRQHLKPGDLLVAVGSGLEGLVSALALRHPGEPSAIAIDGDAVELSALRVAAERAGTPRAIETVRASLGAKAIPAHQDSAPQMTLDGLLGDRTDLAGRRVVLYLGASPRLAEIVAGGLDLLAQQRIAAILWQVEADSGPGDAGQRWAMLLDSLAQLGFRHRRLAEEEGGKPVPYVASAGPAAIVTLARDAAPEIP